TARRRRPRSLPRASKAAGSRSSRTRAIQSRSRSRTSWRVRSTHSWPKLPETLRSEWGANDVLTLTIDRPDRRNALDPELLSAVAEAPRSGGDRAGAASRRGAGTEAGSAGCDLARLTATTDGLEAHRHT